MWRQRSQKSSQQFNKEILEQQLTTLLKKIVQQHKERLTNLIKTLSAIDPKNLLAKGYSIIFSEKEKRVIISTNQLKRLDKIIIQLSDGQVISSVEEIVESDSKKTSHTV